MENLMGLEAWVRKFRSLGQELECRMSRHATEEAWLATKMWR
jgi:hypothetical protein